MKTCLSCSKELFRRHQIKYCSNKCQSEYQYKEFITHWKDNLREGGIGLSTKGISKYVRRYLFEKYRSSCSECGWNKKHPIRGNIPLEVDHVDGNSDNNMEKNLRLLCPNCHSLTKSYKNFNRGKGRTWRVKKYIKNSSTYPGLLR